MIPCVNTFTHGTVVSHKCNAEGNIIGCAHDNPILDSWINDVEFVDGKVTTLSANGITKAMYAQCDPDGNKYILLVKCTDDTLTLDKQKISVNGTTPQQKSTKGWFICYSSISWEKVSNVKDSHPLQVAEFAIQFELH